MEFNIVEQLLAFTLLGSEWVLWLLIILSIVSIAVMVERLIFYARIKIDFAKFNGDLNSALEERSLDRVKTICEQNQSLESEVVLKGLTYADKGAQAMSEGMDSAILEHRQSLDRGLVVLGTLGNNAPFIGLFGTVIGIIQAFNDLANNPGGGPAVVMAGISEALVATAVGLLVAIPAVVAYNAFQKVVKGKITNAEALKRTVTAHYVQS